MTDSFHSANAETCSVQAHGSKDALLEAIETFDEQLKNWAAAYPLSVFPEPDMAKVHALLQTEDMTLDSVSASSMRHVTSKLSELFEPIRAAVLPYVGEGGGK